jgi:hypothetical protein
VEDFTFSGVQCLNSWLVHAGREAGSTVDRRHERGSRGRVAEGTQTNLDRMHSRLLAMLSGMPECQINEFNLIGEGSNFLSSNCSQNQMLRILKPD